MVATNVLPHPVGRYTSELPSIALWNNLVWYSRGLSCVSRLIVLLLVRTTSQKTNSEGAARGLGLGKMAEASGMVLLISTKIPISTKLSFAFDHFFHCISSRLFRKNTCRKALGKKITLYNTKNLQVPNVGIMTVHVLFALASSLTRTFVCRLNVGQCALSGAFLQNAPLSYKTIKNVPFLIEKMQYNKAQSYSMALYFSTFK